MHSLASWWGSRYVVVAWRVNADLTSRDHGMDRKRVWGVGVGGG